MYSLILVKVKNLHVNFVMWNKLTHLIYCDSCLRPGSVGECTCRHKSHCIFYVSTLLRHIVSFELATWGHDRKSNNRNVECTCRFGSHCRIYMSTWPRRTSGHVYYVMTHVCDQVQLENVRVDISHIVYSTSPLYLDIL